MVLGERFEAFLNESPVAVMVAGCLERTFAPERLERVFEDHAVLGYAKELAFARCVEILLHVVFRMSRSVAGYYQAHRAQLPVTRQAVHRKLNGIEPAVSAGLVEHTAADMRRCLEALPHALAPLLAGCRVLDGNHLPSTDHRPLVLRERFGPALPGQALVYYDPRWDLIEAVIPCEDAYAQERSLLGEALARVAPGDCVVADRNFCTAAFLAGVAARGAFFVIRQHAKLGFTATGPRKAASRDGRGRALFEQEGAVADPVTGHTAAVRRTTVTLDRPTRTGDAELHVVTNLPAAVNAAQVAQLYGDRWTVEGAFQRLEADLRSEIDTLWTCASTPSTSAVPRRPRPRKPAAAGLPTSPPRASWHSVLPKAGRKHETARLQGWAS